MTRLLSTLVLAGLLCAPALGAQTLPLPAGDGFAWERVGNTPDRGYRDIAFDAGGTLWTTPNVRWLDPVTNDWIEPSLVGQDAVLPLGPHPVDGPARADTVITTIGTTRSVDGGVTWSEFDPIGGYALAEIPAGYPHAGRLLVGDYNAGYSDDRGATWTAATYGTDQGGVSRTETFLLLPPEDRLPGAASGRDPAPPPGWPAGRVLQAGYSGVIPSDDGGATYSTLTWGSGFGFHAYSLAVVRRPDTHPLGPGPRVLLTAVVSGEPYVSAWSSDDGGDTWARRGYLPEPQTATGYGKTRGLFALPEPGEADPGAGGRAVVVLSLGHLYQTVDAGETWHVVGRAPEMSTPAQPGEPPTVSTRVGAATLGPEGRLHVAVTASPDTMGWVWRTTEAFAVADEAAPSALPGLGVTVSPNPSRAGAVAVGVALAAPSADVRVAVFDAVGRRVAVLHEGPAARELRLRVDASRWAPGVYTVRVTGASGTQASRAFTVTR